MIYDHNGKIIESTVEKLPDPIKTILDSADLEVKDNSRVYISRKSEIVNPDGSATEFTVLPVDDSKSLRLGWVIKEEIGVAVINDYALANISIFSDGIRKVYRLIEPMFEVEDWISPEYWPEWEVVFDDGDTLVVKAPDDTTARRIAKEQHG